MDSFSTLLIGVVSSGFVRMDRRALNTCVQGRVKVRAVIETEGGYDE
jgi:hypothetical protein